ncbi:MAG: hypothetical protein MK077_06980 [Phycisphaerales bacterium]|nr:hypothetical protein [Phycisphaerales bacterium]
MPCTHHFATGALTAMIATTAAHANWFFNTSDVGITAEVVGENLVDGVGTNRTYRLWAVLPDDWRLDAVAGNSEIALQIQPVNGTFYQNPFGGPTSKEISSSFYPLLPSLQWDSYVSIGATDSVGSSSPGNDNTLGNIGIDFSTFEDEGGAINTVNGSWFILPIDSQGQSISFSDACTREGRGVLLGQFTLIGEGATIEGSALLQGQTSLGSTWQAWIDAFSVDPDGICDAIPEVACSADVSGDHNVDVMDLMMVLESWDEGGCADVSGDAKMCVKDLVVVCESWGSCPSSE